MHRNGSGQFLAGNNAHEVSVQDELLGWVTLQGLDDHVLLGATDVQFDHVAESSLVFEQLGDFFRQDGDGLRSLVATVYNGRNLDAGGGSHLSPGRYALRRSG